MKHIRHIFESRSDDNIRKIYDAANELIDEVDNFNVDLFGDLYTVYFNYKIKRNDPMKIIENQTEIYQIYKECDAFVKRLNDIGFDINYYLLETTQHIDYSRMDGKLQIKFIQ